MIPIEEIIVHPNYNPTVTGFDYDVALIKLKEAITFNINVRPVCLPTMDFPPGTNCYVTGWGAATEAGNFPQVNILMLRNLLRAMFPPAFTSHFVSVLVRGCIINVLHKI